MAKELQVVDVETDEVVQRVDVSRRTDDEVQKTRAKLEADAAPGQEVRSVG